MTVPSGVPRRVLVLGMAWALDEAFGEPPAAMHPVVWIGGLTRSLERLLPRGRPPVELAGGMALCAVVVSVAGAAAWVAARLIGVPPALVGMALEAAALKPTFAVRALLEAVESVGARLAAGDLDGARAGLRALVSRDEAALDGGLVAAAAIESLAENISDSVVAPWLFYLCGGLPAAYAYRAANTLDAMVGYRGSYEWLGKGSARIDDLLNLVPARVSAALIVMGAALSQLDGARALAVAWREHSCTASPNAGWPMAAMAGALRVRLEKLGHYRLGAGLRQPGAEDIAMAARVARGALAAGAAGIALGLIAGRVMR